MYGSWQLKINTKILEEIEDAIRSTPQKICFAGTGQMAELAGLLKKKVQ